MFLPRKVGRKEKDFVLYCVKNHCKGGNVMDPARKLYLDNIRWMTVVLVVRGIIIPIAHHVAGGGSSDQTVQAQADTEEVQANSDAAVRQPLKGKSDTDKIAAMTAGWHEDANGKWYQNTDGTYFSNGFQDIDGVTYSFDENGYIQTGWVEKGVKENTIMMKL